jgi:hypothetical protein
VLASHPQKIDTASVKIDFGFQEKQHALLQSFVEGDRETAPRRKRPASTE